MAKKKVERVTKPKIEKRKKDKEEIIEEIKPEVELYNGVEILSKEDRGKETFLSLADGTTTIVENL